MSIPGTVVGSAPSTAPPCRCFCRGCRNPSSSTSPGDQGWRSLAAGTCSFVGNDNMCCDRSSERADICFANGDLRMHLARCVVPRVQFDRCGGGG
jgi:hypothetical protein